MAQPCAASANISVGIFRSLRQLSYNAVITSQRPTAFSTLGRTSYRTGRLLTRSDLSFQRGFRTFAPTYYSSSQSAISTDANSTTVGGEKSPAEDAIPQSEASDGNGKEASNTVPKSEPSPKEKRVKPRRHRKDKPKQTEPASSEKPLVKYIKTPDPKKEPWQIQKEALKRKFKDGWNPRKKLSPDDMERVRHLHAQDPDQFSTPALAERFKISSEAVRRILKSTWRPSEKQQAKRRENWEKRHSKIWNQMSELGLRPKRKSLSPYSDAAVLETKPKAEP